MLLANNLSNFTLVKNGVDGIPHLMGDCRVDQTKELTFSLGIVIEDPLRYVQKAYHLFCFFPNLCIDCTFLYLDEFEFRKEFFLDTLHAC